MTADWTVGWVLNTCEENEGRGIIEVLRDMNLLQWFAAKLNALAGNSKPHEAADQNVPSVKETHDDSPG
jgi:hypothetical protein